MNKKKIVFIHSLNNFTGSPNVLSIIVKEFLNKGYNVEIITSHGEGFLSNLEGVKYTYTCYKWTSNSLQTLLLLFASQITLFFRLLFYKKQNTIYYINTIVPFGAALSCWLTGKEYVYHVHENMRQQKALYLLFRNIYRICNKKSIFVSNYLKETALNCRDGIVVYNSLSIDFINEINQHSAKKKNANRHILMVASLRRFKGIYEFAELARLNPMYTFELVINAQEEETVRFSNELGNIPNLAIYSAKKDLHPFYRSAAILMQLSHPETSIETFGMTILEAMSYGVPCIVPNVGGPTELVENGINGFTINPHDLKDISEKIKNLMENEKLYYKFSKNSLITSEKFNFRRMSDQIENYLFKIT